jgi:hypothetical protein
MAKASYSDGCESQYGLHGTEAKVKADWLERVGNPGVWVAYRSSHRPCLT